MAKMTEKQHDEAKGLALDLHSMLDAYGDDSDDFSEIYGPLDVLVRRWRSDASQESDSDEK